MTPPNLPCVSAVEQEDRTWSRVPGRSQSLHVGSVDSPHRQRLAGDGRRSWTHLRGKDSLSGSSFQMSSQVSFLSMVSHVVHAPCALISTALDCLLFSSVLLTSDCIMARLFYWTAWLHRSVFVAPIPCRPTAVIPTMSLCLSALFAWLTVSVADHFLPVRVTIPASPICSSGESLRVKTNLVLAVLNSSTSEDSGN